MTEARGLIGSIAVVVLFAAAIAGFAWWAASGFPIGPKDYTQAQIDDARSHCALNGFNISSDPAGFRDCVDAWLDLQYG